MKPILFMFCLSMLMISNAQTTTGLQAYFPFDGNALDQGSNSYQTTVNNASLTTDRFNVPGRAYYFNGTNSNIELTTNFPDMNSLTISFWFKPDGTQSNDTGYIFWEGDGYCGSDLSVAYLNQKIYIRADKNGALLNGMVNQGVVDLSLINPAINGWYHFAWVMQPSQSFIYVNGQYRSTATVNGSGVGRHYHPTFGCLNDGLLPPCGTTKGHFLKGSLDDIRIYSLALTAGAVDTIFQNTSVNTGIDMAKSSTYFEIYPNPSVNGKLNFYSNIPFNWRTAEVKIFDMMGREISATVSLTTNHSGRIDFTQAADGIYLMKVVLDGSIIKSVRIKKGD